MIIGRVVGNVVSTAKAEEYLGRKLLLVSPETGPGEFSRNTLVAVDTVDAGIGDVVLVAREGRAAMEVLGSKELLPVRSLVIAVIDWISGLDWPVESGGGL
jgi:microcompartment protein CcmK/EutM